MDANLAAAQSKTSEPDRAEILAQFLALRDVSNVAAAFAGNILASNQVSVPIEEVAAALNNANIWALRQFKQQCGAMGSFMMLGLSALQTARSHNAFNPHAAKRLHDEFKTSETNALAIIGI